MQGDRAAHGIDSWVFIFMLPKEGSQEMRWWFSEQVAEDAPELPAKLVKHIFKGLESVRSMHESDRMKEDQAREREMMRMQQSMENACEVLRKTS